MEISVPGQHPKSAPASTSGRKRKTQAAAKSPPTIDNYWPTMLEEVKGIRQVDAKNQNLPLARIKKIMKLDDSAKMIAAEAPLLFAKACEYFIQELTLRAWVHTEENKRRTLQRSDIAAAISVYDQFDFLIDIVPREEIKQPPAAPTTVKREHTEPPKQPTQQQATTINKTIKTEPIQYYVQLGQQQPQTTVLQNTNGLINQAIPINTAQAGVNLVSPQNILLNTGNANSQQQTLVSSIQNQPQQLQLIQQFLTPNGEITNVPITITPQQMNLLRMQMQGNQPQQVIIPTIQSQQQPQILQINTGTANTATMQTNQNPATSTSIFINAPQTNSIVATDKNLGSTYRPN